MAFNGTISTPPFPFRRHRRHKKRRCATAVRAATLAALAALTLAGPSFASPAPTPAPATAPTTQPAPNGSRLSWQEDVALLQDAALPADARTAACRRLISSPDPATNEALSRLLGPESRTSDTQQIVARELASATSAPGSLLAPLAAWLKELTPDKHAPIYRAISSIRTRDAARLLLSYATPSATAENRDAIYQALIRQTGRHDLGPDREAWTKWLASMDQLSDEQWKSQLAANLAFRADSLRSQRDEALRRLAESERARFLASPDVQSRSSHLAALLRDDLPILRRLGIELVNRELANAREIAPRVGTATLELLNDPSADVRSAGADLVDRLIPAGASIALRDALAREHDPNVLAKLLRLARRFPDVPPPEMLLGWLGADTVVRHAAIDAIAAMQSAGLLSSPIDLERALRTLRSERAEDLSQDGLKLLCELGDDSDRRSVVRMLASSSADTRLRAAQALAAFPQQLDEILAAAENDPTLFSVAASAIARHRPTIDGFQALVQLPAPTPIAMREAVNALGQRLSVPDLNKAAAGTADPEVREAILARVVNLTARDPASPQRDPFAGDDGAALVESLLSLARAQLDLFRPGAALGTLDLLPTGNPAIDGLSAPLRVEAYLYLDRIDDALAVGGTPDSWLDGMEYAVALPHSLAIGSEIDYRFGTQLTPEQRTRLAELTKEARKPREGREARRIEGTNGTPGTTEPK